ncbi:acyl-CoA dehydrogenase [Longispora fulva]|uniref:Aminoglycoside phosphotransferase (APT) family kinase protein n=1 Tax=Longispora fulva TaxID=619741 RepID=A0A8J7GQK3_9ACTN|nr:phosphotransferase family protein [Longispora fulva]MBG6141503.1 aminoglycoside phosphotransferase (APT) family kinase protein [Longispora fulva]GIG59347.1 acyl-CoA dehydrogenase [Longispora fulva]
MSTAEPRRGVDLAALRGWLDASHPGLVTGDLTAERIVGGKSNLTYVLGDGTHRWVLRRPPIGHVLATAHDMGREYTVLGALRATAVPVPGTVAHCPDPAVLGAPFYLMSYVDGTVYRSAAQTAVLDPARARTVAHALMDTLADLHDVEPGAVGLEGFGRPDGFLGRQLRRWKTQLDASRGREIPGIDELHAALAADVPDSGRPAIVHGDYRLDNVLVAADDTIAAVLDWEMATLGDPLTDLGVFLVYWTGLAHLPANAVSDAVTDNFPGGPELIERYAARRAVDLSRLHWYTAFGFFKLAVIAEGIHHRYTAGQTVGGGFDRIGEVVAPLVGLGHAALAEDKGH